MAIATTYPYSGVKVLLESATVPGTYVAPCGLSSRTISFTKETNDIPVIDCDDDDLISPVVRDVVSSSVSISGDGLLARESLPRWRLAYEDNDPVNVKVTISGSGAQGGGSWTGAFHLTSFEVSPARGVRTPITITMLSSGAVTWAAAS